MSPSPRPEIAALPRVVHGAVKDQELAVLAASGISPDQVLDFSVNSNPLGPSPRVQDALSAIDVSRYPDDTTAELRAALSARFRISADRLLVANGSSELIWLACLAYIRPGDAVAIFGPTFGEYARAVAIAGGAVVRCDSTPADGFHLEPGHAAAWLHATAPSVVFLCNPNNPTGAYLDAPSVAALVDAATDALFVIDEAYAPFLSGPTTDRRDGGLRALVHLMDTGRVLLLRSMTKDGALAGLRLGYAAAAEPVIAALGAAKPPWSVNRAALAAGLATLQDDDHWRRSRAAAVEAVTYLRHELRTRGFHVYDSRANYFLVDVGDARATRERLLRRGLVVRDCTSFGLPSMVRIAARPIEDCRQLVAALEDGMPASGSARDKPVPS
jgi:histidinol-phosphate aminotransferase